MLTDAAKRELKERANWQCQECQRFCRKPREPIDAFIQRVGDAYWQELCRDCEENPGNTSDLIGVFTLCVLETEQDPIVLCSSCAMHYIRPTAAPKHEYWRRELNGQLSLPI